MENTEMRKEGDLAFPAEENEDSLESSPETNEADETDVVDQDKKEDEPDPKEKPKEEEKIVPLHKDERFREVIQENKEMKEKLADLEDFRTKVEPLLKPDVKIPSWFGGDEDQYRAYKADRDQELKEAKSEALKEFDERGSKQSKAIQEANQYLEDSILEIESEGNKIDRNKLLKIVMDNELIDSKGRWNYKAGFKLLQALEPAKDNTTLNEKKKLAASTTSDDKPETTPRDYKTSEDFKGGNAPW